MWWATLGDHFHNGLMTFIEEETHPQLTRPLIGRLIWRMKQANKNDGPIRRAGCLGATRHLQALLKSVNAVTLEDKITRSVARTHLAQSTANEVSGSVYKAIRVCGMQFRPVFPRSFNRDTVSIERKLVDSRSEDVFINYC